MAEPVYVVVVTCKFKPGKLEVFKELWKPLSEYVTANEEGALTYKLSTGGAEDPDAALIFERYVSKSYFEEVHSTSAPFKEFFKKLEAADITAETSFKFFYEEPAGAFGHVTRS